MRAVSYRRIIEIFTSNYLENARLSHSVIANFSHLSSSMRTPDISKIRDADMPTRGNDLAAKLSGDEFRTRHLILTEARIREDLRAWRKCALNVTQTHEAPAMRCTTFSWRWYVTTRDENLTKSCTCIARINNAWRLTTESHIQIRRTNGKIPRL